MWWQLLPTSIGIWLMFAPWALGYEGSAAETSDRVVGPFVACFGIVAMGAVTRNVRFWNLPLGAWLIVSPLLIAYPPAGIASTILSGIAVIALAFFPRNPRSPAEKAETYAGGWTTIWKKDPFDVAHGSADFPANENGTAHVDTRTR